MRQSLIAYVSTLVTFFALDFAWISFATNRLYKPQLGALLADKPNLLVGSFFYFIYMIGVVYFVVNPALSENNFLKALGSGALLGLVAYGAYDFTNQATIVGWPVAVTLCDLAWGTFVTAIAATVGFFVTKTVSG